VNINRSSIGSTNLIGSRIITPVSGFFLRI